MTELRNRKAGSYSSFEYIDGEDDWQADAVCRGMNQDLFFGPGDGAREEHASESARRVARAKAICFSCPVRIECLSFALRIGERHGVWGGLTAKERRNLALFRRRG